MDNRMVLQKLESTVKLHCKINRSINSVVTTGTCVRLTPRYPGVIWTCLRLGFPCQSVFIRTSPFIKHVSKAGFSKEKKQKLFSSLRHFGQKLFLQGGVKKRQLLKKCLYAVFL